MSSVEIYIDFKLIIGWMTREFEARDEKLVGYLMKVRDLQRKFTSFKITKVPCIDNELVDALYKFTFSNLKICIARRMYKSYNSRAFCT